MTARGLKGSPRSFVLAGLLAGLATLSRTDGILVLGVVLLAFAWDRTRGRGVIPASAAVGAVAAFVLVMAPWWIRQLAVFGTLSPSMASGKVLFIRSIGEWNSIATPATLEHLLGMGAGPLIASRVGGFVAAVDDLRRPDRGARPRAVHRRRRVGPPPFGGLRPVLHLCRRAIRFLDDRVRRPRSGRDVHPLCRCAGAVQLRPGAGGGGGRRRLARAPANRLGPWARNQIGHRRHGRGCRRAGALASVTRRPRGLGRRP